MTNVKTLAKQLKNQSEITFEYNGTTVVIWETDQGDENIRGKEYMNYMYNLYDTVDFKLFEDDTIEYDGGLCEGTPKDAIKMAILQIRGAK